MRVVREEPRAIPMFPLRRSKALEAAGYDVASRTLRLRFRHGGEYDYLDVPPAVHEGLTTSAHPWTEWAEEIQDHDYVRLDR